ncbi:hypothetical protein VPHD227_0100 [Vibrio phage D227]
MSTPARSIPIIIIIYFIITSYWQRNRIEL